MLVGELYSTFVEIMNEQLKMYSVMDDGAEPNAIGGTDGSSRPVDESYRELIDERESQIVEFREKFLYGANPLLACAIEQTLGKMSLRETVTADCSSTDKNRFVNVYTLFQR